MANSFSNPYGAVQVADGGTPRVMTIKARADISGGCWVAGSSAGGAIGSGDESYVASDIEGFPISTIIGSRCIGLALQNISSGTYGPIAQRGQYIVPCASGTIVGSIVAGMKVAAGSAGTVISIGSSTLQDFEAGIDYTIGTALSEGGGNNEQFVLISLNI